MKKTAAKTFLSLTFFLFIVPSPYPVVFADDGKKVIGEVLGIPLTSEHISISSHDDLRYNLDEFVIKPLFKKYYDQHARELEPTAMEITDFLLFCKKEHEKEIMERKAEIDLRIKEISRQLQENEPTDKEQEDLLAEIYFLNAELEPPGYDYAMFVVPYWKIQNHLYAHFGGGRILRSERGYEAYDAMLKWLEDQEKKGNFVIHDKAIRKELYRHWKDEEHGKKLITDKKLIDTQFIHPQWLSNLLIK